MRYNLGQTVELAFSVTPDETPTLTVTAPDGTVSSPVVTGSAGSYTALVDANQAGTWTYIWTTPNGGDEHGQFEVGVPVVSLLDAKLRLNKATTVDDAELQAMLDAAIEEYRDRVGPIGTKTLRYDGGRASLILPLHSTVTAVTYSDGTPIPLADLDFDADSGILHWRYGTGGWFTAGQRNVLVTFTVTLPAHHREAILADVAGYFAATQRGNSIGALPTEGYAAGYEDRSTPVVLFPRIRALAADLPAIA